MIAATPKGAIDAAEDGLAAMLDARELAMNGFWRPDDVPAKSLAQRLMAEANPKNWNCWRCGCDERETNPGVAGRAGPGREHDRLGRRFHNCGHAYAIVAVHRNLGALPAEAMHQVPGETVVIVNERYGSHPGIALSLCALLGLPWRKVKFNGYRKRFCGWRGSAGNACRKFLWRAR